MIFFKLTYGWEWCYTTVVNVKSFIQGSGVRITIAACRHRHAGGGTRGWCRKEEVMRKTKKKLLAALLSAAMLTGSVLAPCQADTASAAVKIKTNKTKVTVTVGKTVKVKVKNTGSRKIKAKVSNKKIITVKAAKKQIKITGKKAGNAKVTLTAGGMKKCVIRVAVKSRKKNEKTTPSPVTSAKTVASAKPATTAAVMVSSPTGVPTQKPTAAPNIPKDAVSRIQWVKGLVNELKLPMLSSEDMPVNNLNERQYSYRDMDKEEDKLAVETVIAKGAITNAEIEQTEKEFHPDSYASKEFIYVTAVRILGYLEDNVSVSCAEIDANDLYAKYDQLAIDLGIAAAGQNGLYGFRDGLSKTEMDTILETVKKQYDELNKPISNVDNSVFADEFNDKAVSADAEYTIAENGTGYTVEIASDSVKNLKKGQSFYLPESGQCPDGIALIADSIEEKGNTTVISASAVTSCEEIYSTVDVQRICEVTAADFTPAEGVSVVTEAPMETETPDGNSSLKKGEESKKNKLNLEIKGHANCKFDIKSPELLVSLKMKKNKLQEIDAHIEQDATMNAEFAGEIDTGDIKLGEISLTILPKAGVRANFELTASFHAEGSVTIDIEVNDKAGMAYKNGRVRPYNDLTYKSNSHVNAKAEAELKADVGLNCLEYKIFGREITHGFILIDFGASLGVVEDFNSTQRASAEIKKAKLNCETSVCKDIKIYPKVTIFAGDKENSLFREVYDERVDKELLSEETAPLNLKIHKHTERLDNQKEEEVPFCRFEIGDVYDNIEGDYELSNDVLIVKGLSEQSIREWKDLYEKVRYLYVDVDQEHINLPEDYDTSGLFEGLTHLKYAEIKSLPIKNAGYMFYRCVELKKVDARDWDTSMIEDMHGMFESCAAIEEVLAEHWDTNRVKSLSSMFENCESLSQLSCGDWKLTKTVQADRMFAGCTAMKSFAFANNWEVDEADAEPEFIFVLLGPLWAFDGSMFSGLDTFECEWETHYDEQEQKEVLKITVYWVKEMPGWYMTWVENKARECEKNYDGVVSTPDNL